MTMNVARVVNGVVVNLEVVTPEWFDAHKGTDPAVTFVEYLPDTILTAYVGAHWDTHKGFHDPDGAPLITPPTHR